RAVAAEIIGSGSRKAVRITAPGRFGKHRPGRAQIRTSRTRSDAAPMPNQPALPTPLSPAAPIRPTPPALSPWMALRLVLATLCWGGTFIAGRVLAQSMPLMTAAFCRFLVAAVLLVILAFKWEGGLPRL